MSKAQLRRKVTRYLKSVDRVLRQIEITSPEALRSRVGSVVETARRYSSDASYYKNGQDLVTSLATIAYSEGLLDALRMLGLVEFDWE